MSRFLFHILCLLTLEVIFSDFSGWIFADSLDNEEDNDDSDDQEDAEQNNKGRKKSRQNTKGEEKDEEERVRTIVDSLLKINKHVDVNNKKSESKENREKRKSQEDESDKSDEKRIKTEKLRDGKKGKKSGGKRESWKKQRNRRHSGSYGSSYSPNRIYTVKKNVHIPSNATNSYLDRIRVHKRNYKIKGRYQHHSESKPIEYKVKSYGGATPSTATLVPVDTEKKTVKSSKYFNKCTSSSGCS
ncbi:MAG: hypothetical protein LBF57_01640 [Holosporaceae bacterium]|jgi:hypothetical protein|nr:hypothetical protein [Holosporaceae bacterium]